MKKVIFTISTFAFLSLPFYNANAQMGSTEYIQIKWNILNIGGVLPQGVNIVQEPQYLITNNIGISLKLEYAVITNRVNDNVRSSRGISSLMPTGFYYFNLQNVIRPWVSLGAGFGRIEMSGPRTNSDVSNSTRLHVLSLNEVTGLAVSLRVGIDFRHMVVAVVYHFNPASKGTIRSFNEAENVTTTDVSLSNNYLGTSVGIFLGGGRKKK